MNEIQLKISIDYLEMPEIYECGYGYNWDYFKNKYSHFMKYSNEKERKTSDENENKNKVSRKRKYEDAFDPLTFEFMRFGDIDGDKYIFKLKEYDLHIKIEPYNPPKKCEKFEKKESNEIVSEKEIGTEKETKNKVEKQSEEIFKKENEGIEIIIQEKNDDIQIDSDYLLNEFNKNFNELSHLVNIIYPIESLKKRIEILD